MRRPVPAARSWVEPSEDAEDATLRAAAPPHRCLVVVAVCCLLALELAAAVIQSQHRLPDAGRRSAAHAVAEAADAAPALRRAAAAAADSSSASSGSACGGGAGDHTSKAFEPIVFFIMVYLLSAFAQQLEIVSPASFRVPHSVVLFLSGLAMGRVGEWAPDSEFGRTIADFMDVDPHIIFWVLLPALLYEDASGVKWHVMKKVLPSALLLAVPGVIVNALLTGAIIKGIFGTIEWTWDAAFLLGTILSATDPVAVVGALHELAAPDRLSLLISGESLFNDGSAVVIFGLFWDSARGVRELTPGYSIAYFIRLACGGPLLGLAFAIVAFVWLKQTRKFSIEILVIVITVYGSFFVAEHPDVKVSGVLAVVIFGFFMAARGHFALHIEENERHHAVIRFLALLSNEAIFVLAGVVSFRVLLAGYSTFQVRDWLELVLLYFIIHGTRALILLLAFPLLRRWGYGCSVKEAMICLFGGLRGAVGLAMALMVEHDARLDDATRARIAFHTSGIVLATLLVNGTLITTFYKRLHVYSKAQHHEKLLRMALVKADALTMRRGVMFEQHWFFHNCFFAELFQAVPNLVQAAEELERKREGSHGHSHEMHATKDVNNAMADIANRLGALGEQGLHDRYMQKLRFRRRWARSASNVFLSASLASATEDEQAQYIVNELAMRMANLDAKQSEAEAEGTEVASVDEMDRTVTQDSDARQDDDTLNTLPSFSPPGAVVRAKTPERSETPTKSETPTARGETRTRSSQLKPPQGGALPKPIIAWSNSDLTQASSPLRGSQQAEAPESDEASMPKTPMRRPGSRVTFADSERSDEAGLVQAVWTPISEAVDRGRSMLSSVTALPSMLTEKDQRILYMQLVEGARARVQELRQEFRNRSKSSAAESSTSPTSETPKIEVTEPSPAPSRKSTMQPRTNLQALRVEALFQDASIRSISQGVTMALVQQELKTAEEKNNRKAIAKARWKIAKTKVFWALRKIQNALEEHQKLVEGAEKGARLFAKGRTFSSSHFHIQNDPESMVEIRHMIVNATRAAYKEMYEAHSLPEGPFRVLMESLELQEEAIDGELLHAVCAPRDPELDMKLVRLPSGSHQEQMDLSFTVSFMYIAESKNRAWYKGGFCSCLQKRYFRLPQWWQMVSDVVIMLAFIMTAEGIAEELEVIQDFEESVKKPMLQVTERARAAYLYQVMLQNPAMFFLFEHVLCLRLMLDFQQRLVMDLVHDGLLCEEDAEDMLHRVIDPIIIALDRYVPTFQQLRTASRQCTGGRGRMGFGGQQRVAPEPIVAQEGEDTTHVW